MIINIFLIIADLFVQQPLPYGLTVLLLLRFVPINVLGVLGFVSASPKIIPKISKTFNAHAAAGLRERDLGFLLGPVRLLILIGLAALLIP